MVNTSFTTKATFAPLVPGDHGAYAMLLIPALVGLIAGVMRGLDPALNFWPAAGLLLIALLAVFFAFEPLEILAKPGINEVVRKKARSWLGIYLAAALVSSVPLVLVWQRWWLVGLAIPAVLPLVTFLIAKKWRKQRSLGVRWLGIAGLVVSGPACYYLATGVLDRLALGLWVAGLVYFGSSLFYVRVWFEAKKRQKTRPNDAPVPGWLLGLTLGYLALGLLALVGLAVTAVLPWTALLAFAPMVVKMFMALRRPPTYIPIKQVGLYEFAQSFVFALLLLLALR